MIYEYTREQIPNDGRWNIDNPLRVDGEGNQIYLAKEIEAVVPGKFFIVCCFSALCNIEFVEELSSGEKTMLDAIVATHKNNT